MFLNRAILGCAIFMLLTAGQCMTLTSVEQKICTTEERLHADYISFVAPFRSADKQALELANYTQIKAACLTGNTFQVLFSLANAAVSLRK